MDMVVEALNGGHNVRSLSKTEMQGKTKKNRIIYDKEFLVECCKHPASSKKPTGFPLPNLECTLGAARTTKTPYVMNPKRKDEGLKKDKENPDSISLRPQSASFVSGCAANLTSAHLNQTTYGGRFQGNDDQPRGFYDREFPRPSSSRFTNTKSSDSSDRARVDKDKEREKEKERDDDRERAREHEHENRPAFRKMYGQGPPITWGGDMDQPGWGNRRKVHNGNATRYEREHARHIHHDRDRRQERDKPEDDEPEWYSEGPTSRLDTIELRGFTDDVRGDDKKNSKPAMQSNGFAIDTAAMLSISYIADEKNETEKPTGSSRFSDIFQRNMEAKAAGVKKISEKEKLEHPEPEAPDLTIAELSAHYSFRESKTQEVQELEVALRTILFRGTKLDQRGYTDNSEFVKMIESMSFRKQVAEEEKIAQEAAAKKIEEDALAEANKAAAAREAAERAAERAAEEAAAADAVWEENLRASQQQNYIVPSQTGFYYHPQTTANFIPMTAAPGVQTTVPVMMPPMEQVHQFPIMHAQPQQYLNAYPLHNEFVAPAQQFQQSRVQVAYPYYQTHPALVAPNPLQIFQDQVRHQHWGGLTPAQVYSMLSPEFKKQVDNANVTSDFLSRPDVNKVINNLSTGVMPLSDLAQQIVGPQQIILTGVLKYAMQGGFPIRGVCYPPQYAVPQPPPVPGHFQPQMHFVPNQVRMGVYPQSNIPIRAQDFQRTGVQVLPSTAFLPTSVMRKMTAEQHVRQIIPTSGNSQQLAGAHVVPNLHK